MKEIGKSAAWLRRGSGVVAAYAVLALGRALASIVSPAYLMGLVSLAFSAVSLYVTVLEQPRLKILAGCNWQYGRGPGSFDEYFVVPITVVNYGARGGTVLAVDLVVDKSSPPENPPKNPPSERPQPRPFAGTFTAAGFDGTARQLYAPLAVAGHSSASSTIVFTERTRTGPPLFDLATFNRPDRLQATLKFRSVAPVSYGFVDRLLASPPEEARFEPVLQPADIAPVFADRRAVFDACTSGPSNRPGGM
jgi:hypothetical protein